MDTLYQVVYDITQTSPSSQFLFMWLMALAGGLLVFIFRMKLERYRRSRKYTLIFFSVWIALFGVLGGLAVFSTFSEHSRCVNWAKQGQYSVVEGKVEHFQAPGDRGKQESFSVSGVAFEYSQHDQSKCGFHQDSAAGGPMREGLPVRVSYRDGRILKLEIHR